tara:strand:+ start:172 stop:537 length:366 start_codon:yes stop_codon:yes gene_type:complete
MIKSFLDILSANKPPINEVDIIGSEKDISAITKANGAKSGSSIVVKIMSNSGSSITSQDRTIIWVFIAKNEKVLERNNHRNSLLDKELVNVCRENPGICCRAFAKKVITITIALSYRCLIS